MTDESTTGPAPQGAGPAVPGAGVAMRDAALRFLRRFGLVAAAWSTLLALSVPVADPTLLAAGIGVLVAWALASQLVRRPRVWFAGWFVVAIGVELLGPLAGTAGRSVSGGVSFLVLSASALTGRRRDVAATAAVLAAVAVLRGVVRPDWSVTGSVGTVLLFAFGGIALSWLVRAVTRAEHERDRLAVRATTAEREAAVAHERAEAAARLHDSVLQTLTAIGRAGSAEESTRLARRAGAELRDFLRRSREPDGGSLADALRSAVTRAADGAPVGVSVVGDAPLDTAGSALVDAASEAVRNAVTHGSPPVRVLLECDARGRTAWVSDGGDGFALDTLPPDRLGVRGSILDRLAGVDGSARLHATDGCEWELRVPPAPPHDVTAPATG